MQFGIGLLFTAIGLGMFFLSNRHRKHIRARWAEAEKEEAEGGRTICRERPMNYGDMLAPLVNFSLLVVSVTLVFSFLTTELSTVLSWLDLLGVLFCLVGYGTLVSMKVRYRPPYFATQEEDLNEDSFGSRTYTYSPPTAAANEDSTEPGKVTVSASEIEPR